MIDCENEVFTRVATMLRERFPGIFVSGEYIKAPSSFPHVSIVQTDTHVDQNRITNSLVNEFEVVVFEVNIYSNRTQGKKTECKQIAKAVADLLHSMNFIRTAQTPVPNMEDASIYRIVARYRVTTDGIQFYRR